MMRMNKMIAGLLACICLFSCVIPVFAQGSTINISSADEFKDFAKSCTLDSWSQGKTVNLTCDIDFSGIEFSPVPTFGGTFNGNGYTISGINISQNGSYMGLFRYIQQSGKVMNLNVKAVIVPSGSKSFIGGVSGENSGVIEKCTFEGDIKGENVIGGIAGNNTENGQIISCTSSGSIIGENSSGGIAGKNEGLILNCVNDGEINTVYEEQKNDSLNIETDTDAIIESYRNNQEETEEDDVLGHTNIGGISGLSSGIIQGCINYASVGYPHVGYNVGGIAGIQSGYLLGCKNYGLIQGRKDIGGIVGQAEPYILLNTSGNALEDIHKEIINLNTMVNQLVTDTDSIGDETDIHLDEISKYLKSAQNNTETMMNSGTDFANDNIGEVNAQAAILSNTLDKLVPVFEDLENSGSDLETSLNEISNALEKIEIYAPDLGDEIDDINSSLNKIADAEKSMSKASFNARQAINDLDDAIEINSPRKIKNAVSALVLAVDDIMIAERNIKTELEKIVSLLEEKPDDIIDLGINVSEIIKNLKAITENIAEVISSLETVNKNLNVLINNVEIDFSAFRSAADNSDDAIGYIEDAMKCISDGIYSLTAAIDNTWDEIEIYTDDVSEQLNGAKEDLSSAVTSLSYASDDIRTGIGDMKQIVSDLAKEESLEFVKINDDFKDASENLFDSLTNVSNEIDGLKNTVSNGKDTVSQDMLSISNQIYLIMNLLTGEFEELQSTDTNISDVIVDVSDEDIENTKQGKVEQCQNSGRVEADRNGGGIAGAMAIEYSKDPEDEIEKPDTFHFTYQTKAILQACINEGEITGKKDCIGGIAGLSEIGTVYKCENYGGTNSTNGNYVGGIAGKSESSIRKSYSKCKGTGKRFVGGIAGKGETISECYAIASVTGDENTGAVCGQADSNDKIRLNFFVDNGLGAVDGISYKGFAEPVSFENLKNTSGIPKRFISFTVTFIAENETVETQNIEYGSETARIQYPDIPEKEGYFGVWQKPDCETVTEDLKIVCEYKKNITTLSSAEKNNTGKLALALAEGQFTDKAELHITENTQIQPLNENGKVYDIVLSDTNIQSEDVVNIRILNENKDKVTAWCLEDGEWSQTEVKERGKYVMIKTKGAQSTVCLQYTEKGFNFIWIIVILIVVSISVILIKNKFKNKQHNKTE